MSDEPIEQEAAYDRSREPEGEPLRDRRAADHGRDEHRQHTVREPRPAGSVVEDVAERGTPR